MCKYIVTEDINSDDYPWLDVDVPKGLIVYEYFGYTYGCISNSGIAVTLEENTLPFFEVPLNKIKELL